MPAGVNVPAWKAEIDIKKAVLEVFEKHKRLL